MAALFYCVLARCVKPQPPSLGAFGNDTSASATATATAALAPDDLDPVSSRSSPCGMPSDGLSGNLRPAPRHFTPPRPYTCKVGASHPGNQFCRTARCARGMAKPSAAISGAARPYFLYTAFVVAGSGCFLIFRAYTPIVSAIIAGDPPGNFASRPF